MQKQKWEQNKIQCWHFLLQVFAFLNHSDQYSSLASQEHLIEHFLKPDTNPHTSLRLCKAVLTFDIYCLAHLIEHLPSHSSQPFRPHWFKEHIILVSKIILQAVNTCPEIPDLVLVFILLKAVMLKLELFLVTCTVKTLSF